MTIVGGQRHDSFVLSASGSASMSLAKVLQQQLHFKWLCMNHAKSPISYCMCAVMDESWLVFQCELMQLLNTSWQGLVHLQ